MSVSSSPPSDWPSKQTRYRFGIVGVSARSRLPSNMISSAGRAMATPPMPRRSARRPRMSFAMVLLRLPEAEGVARRQIDHELIEVVIVRPELRPEVVEDGVVADRLAPPDRE